MINNYIVDLTIANDIGYKTLQQYQFLPLVKTDIYIIVAIYNNNYIDKIRTLFHTPIKFITVTKNELQFELHNFEIKYKIFNLALKAQQLNTTQTTNKTAIYNFCDKLFLFAIKINASDIHFETIKYAVIIRFRIDGILVQFFKFEYEFFPIISSILKLFASLDISQRRLPQDGRFSRKIGNDFYDFRVSTLPTISGESIVLRILDNKKAFLKLDQIGFNNEVYQKINTNINKTNGLILITGPTGSGKTTTLYSILNQLNKIDKKIITAEDPIEYNINGIMQVNINEQIGLDYATILKNILRQDPDIIMIGEIRDQKSLQIAIQASLTGHLVIATLHTNSAAKTINRLLDLKAPAYLLASTLRLIVSQRLIRVLCNNCKEQATYKEHIIYKAKGCKQCNLTGYISREIVTEILEIDEQIANLINTNKIQDIQKIINYTTISDEIYNKVLQGITSLDEYYRYEI